MQNILNYEAWIDAVCHICNSLSIANVSIAADEFKVAASKYRWVTFGDCSGFEAMYNEGLEPAFGATRLMEIIIEQWDELLVEEDGR